MDQPLHFDEDALTQKMAWVRRLAYRLVRDRDLAHDLAQDTYLAALGSKSKLRPASIGPWLARVLKNFWLQHWRSEKSRRQRELAVARPESNPDAPELLLKLEVHREIVCAVRELKEPYRSVIMLRYFEELLPSEIAARRNLPVTTVNSQISRAIHQLRGMLESRFGPKARSRCLVLLAGCHTLTSPPALVTIMKTKLAFAAVALTCLALVLAWQITPESSYPSPGMVTDEVSPVLPIAGAEIEAVKRDELGVRDEERQPTISGPTFEGTVVDANGSPMSDFPVLMTGTVAGEKLEREGRSGPDGIFELPVPENTVQLVSSLSGWTTVVPGVADRDVLQAGIEPVVVVAPSMAISGALVSDQGPLMGGLVRVVLPREFRSRFSEAMDRSWIPSRSSATSADGRFVFAELGAVPGTQLHAQHDGYLPQVVEAPSSSAEDLIITMERPRAVPGRVMGQVIDASGLPVEGAHVSLGRAGATTGHDGLFSLDVTSSAGYLQCVAVKRGYLPAQKELAEVAVFAQSNSPPPFIYLQLGNEPLRIWGAVVDHLGNGVSGAKVWVDDATVVPNLEGRIQSLEGYLNGGATPRELESRFVRNGEPIQEWARIFAENPTSTWGWVRSDEEGHFELPGLVDRSYRLRALDPQGSMVAVAEDVPAGSEGTILRFPNPASLPELRGVVVDQRGEPVSGVEVQVSRLVVNLVWNQRGRESSRGQASPGESVATDQEGLFELGAISPENCALSLTGDYIIPRRVELDASARLDNLRIQVSRRLHFQVQLTDIDFADGVEARNDSDEAIAVHQITWMEHIRQARFPIMEGRSQVLAVSENVSYLVLYRGRTEVDRIHVSFQPGTVNRVTR